MSFVKLDETGKVIQKQPYAEPGFVSAPDHVICGMVLLNGVFVAPPPTAEQLLDYLGQVRWASENGGFSFNGFTIATDDRSKLLINGAITRAMQENDPEKLLSFKAKEGFVTITNSVMISIGGAIADHVRKCFAAEAIVAELINSDAVVTREQVSQAFEAAFNNAQ